MEERIYYVYEYRRLDNNSVFYVGKGSKNRWKEIYNRSKHFKRITKKVETAGYIVKDKLTESEAFALEEDLIYKYVFEEGYSINIKGIKPNELKCHLVNSTWGGEGASGHSCPFKGVQRDKQTKQKISLKNKGRKKTEIEIEHSRKRVLLILPSGEKKFFKSIKECNAFFGFHADKKTTSLFCKYALKNNVWLPKMIKEEHKKFVGTQFLFLKDNSINFINVISKEEIQKMIDNRLKRKNKETWETEPKNILTTNKKIEIKLNGKVEILPGRNWAYRKYGRTPVRNALKNNAPYNPKRVLEKYKNCIGLEAKYI